ncbi:hypothetical protein J3E64_002430 [Sphingobium sp. OAS761]|uniref:hypothetical protein n=1 Tax=Sphingobium sp. OAS761 TaxID=2817901 RepID=UPI00209EE1F5|nr:hypothetical protein [Sphingobium sp. OAS761]MCP1470737.1 hypothetical protein [Sphingobium sp. OAS761]
MYADNRRGRGIPIAIVAAGPVFISCYFLADLYLRLPDALAFRLTDLPGHFGNALLLLGLSVVVGVPLSIMPILTGLVLMQGLSAWHAGFRSSIFWALAGGMIGALPLIAFPAGEMGGPLCFALIVTSTLCGWLCGRWQ